VIKSRAFSMEEGGAPRDVLRRRVRTAEFYYGHTEKVDNASGVFLYDEFTDNFVKITSQRLQDVCSEYTSEAIGTGNNSKGVAKTVLGDVKDWLLIRPCIEHYMLAAIIGRGGMQHLGATLWGQTELSVFDDGQHGKLQIFCMPTLCFCDVGVSLFMC